MTPHSVSTARGAQPGLSPNIIAESDRQDAKAGRSSEEERTPDPFLSFASSSRTSRLRGRIPCESRTYGFSRRGIRPTVSPEFLPESSHELECLHRRELIG